VYRHVANTGVMTELLMEYLEEYNITFPSQMHLVSQLAVISLGCPL
jgi:hypothetical protein